MLSWESYGGALRLRSTSEQDVSDADEAAPTVIREEPLLTLWYRPDTAFCTPKAVVCAPRPFPDCTSHCKVMTQMLILTLA